MNTNEKMIDILGLTIAGTDSPSELAELHAALSGEYRKLAEAQSAPAQPVVQIPPAPEAKVEEALEEAAPDAQKPAAKKGWFR